MHSFLIPFSGMEMQTRQMKNHTQTTQKPYGMMHFFVCRCPHSYLWLKFVYNFQQTETIISTLLYIA